MSLSGLVTGALLLLGVGAVVYYGPKLWEGLRSTLTGWKDSLTAGVQRLIDAPGRALDYVQTSHDLELHPEQILEKDPITGQPLTGYIGGTDGKDLSQTVADNRAEAAKQRSTEPKATTIKRLQDEQATLKATGQPYIIDLDSGGQKVTLDDVTKQLAALGVA